VYVRERPESDSESGARLRLAWVDSSRRGESKASLLLRLLLKLELLSVSFDRIAILVNVHYLHVFLL
jgi:hypothetical protein